MYYASRQTSGKTEPNIISLPSYLVYLVAVAATSVERPQDRHIAINKLSLAERYIHQSDKDLVQYKFEERNVEET